MKWVHHCGGLGQLFCCGSLEPGESVHGDHLDPGAEALALGPEPGGEHGLGASFDHVQQPRWTGSIANRGQIDDHGHVVGSVAGVAPAVLIDPDHRDPIEPARILEE